jgi:DNA-binding transcriptional regulator YbjK
MSTRGASRKGQERSEAILEAAERLLVDEGHAALTLRGVAQRTGIRLGNLQYYFATREELVRALLARVLERATARLEARVGAVGGSAGSLDTALEFLLEDQKDSDSYRLFYDLWALAAREPAIAAELRGFYARYTDTAAELLARRRSCPAPRPACERNCSSPCWRDSRSSGPGRWAHPPAVSTPSCGGSCPGSP